MKNKDISEIVESITKNFRCFGGGNDGIASNNPIAMALKDKSAQFAAGVDVKEVVVHVLHTVQKQSRRKK